MKFIQLVSKISVISILFLSASSCKPQINSMKTRELYNQNSAKVKCVLMVRYLEGWGIYKYGPKKTRINPAREQRFFNKLAKLSDKNFLTIPVTDQRKLNDDKIYRVVLSYLPCEESQQKINKLHKATFKQNAEITIVTMDTYLAAYQGKFYVKNK